MSLFQDGNFKSHAGLPLKWKLECDAITDDEWRCLAKIVMEYQERPFYKAVGIPRGGLKFAEAMNEYASGNEEDSIMVCDDVFTTGTSFKEFINENYPMWSAGQGFRWVVFARRPCYEHPHHVRALFTMPNPIEERYKQK